MQTPSTRLLPLASRLLAFVLAAGLLAACRREPEPVEGAPREPVAAVEALADALRDGDVPRYAQLSLPPAMRVEQAALWERQRAVAPPVDQQAMERYDRLMGRLLAPDAEAALWAEAEPRLAAMQQELGPKWTLGVTMLAGFASAAIAADETLSEAEKSHAGAVVDALAAWAGEQAQFTDPASAKAAIGIAVRTARELDLPTLDALQALDHAAVLEKGGVALRGAKAIAQAYGIDFDAALSQVQAEVIALEDARAVVRVRYPLLGEQVSFEQPMRLIDGGWYREDAIASHQAAMAAEAGRLGADEAAPLAAPAN